MKKYYIFIAVLIIFLVFSCIKKNPSKEFTEIINNLRNIRYEKSIELLERFDKKYPGFQLDQVNVPITKVKCYEAMGELEKALEVYNNEALKAWQPSISPFASIIDSYEILMQRLYTKIFDFDKSYEIAEKYLELLKAMDENQEKYEGIIDNMNGLFLESLVDNLMYVITVNMNNENKEVYYAGVDDDINYVFTHYLVNYNKADPITQRLIDLVDYKTMDGEYHSDIIWSREITKEYFKKFVDKKFITKKTLEKVKSFIYRKELPEDFVKLFEEYL